MKKIGIIRCQLTEDLCPGTTCLYSSAKGKGAFAELGECLTVGIVSCGGCSGKKAVMRAKLLVERGAEVVALASCITKGTPIGFVCPHKDAMHKAIRNNLAENIKIIEYTHEAKNVS